MPSEQFSAISWWEQAILQWDDDVLSWWEHVILQWDDDVFFVPYQHA
jgi:hypothetical protein